MGLERRHVKFRQPEFNTCLCIVGDGRAAGSCDKKCSKQEGLAKAAVNGLVNEACDREQLDYYGLYPVLLKVQRSED